MWKSAIVFAFLLAGSEASQSQGLNGTPEFQAQQAALEKTYPQLKVTDEYLHLSIPGQTMGETMGVAQIPRGICSSTPAPNQGIARGGKAASCSNSTRTKFVKEWGPNNYGESFAHDVRVDKSDNVWSVDEGSGMVVKWNPRASISSGWPDPGGDRLSRSNWKSCTTRIPHAAPPKPVGRMGTFDRETDVARIQVGQYLRI